MNFRVKYLLLFVAMTFGVESVMAQGNGFISPLDFPIQFSGNYGELRTNHFHSGVDIRVGGVVGAPIHAMADGYVSRIFVSTYGFGKAIYVAHPNGYTTVYCHLDRFEGDIFDYAIKQQYSRKSFSVDLYPEAGSMPVKQGQVIGYAGNSGSSGGPHLHLDVRNSAAVPINPVVAGIIKVEDTIAPEITAIHRVEVDTLCGIARHSVTATYTTVATSKDNYTIKEVDKINIRRPTYFAIEVKGRKDANSFSMGPYSVDQKVDGKTNFAFKVDNISYANMRYANATSYYPISRVKGGNIYGLVRLPANKLPIYSSVVDNGILSCERGETKTLSIDVMDDCGNLSTLSFNIYGYPYSESEREAQSASNEQYCIDEYSTTTPQVVYYDRDYNHSFDGARVSIPAGSLYKSMLLKADSSPKDERSLAPYYNIGSTDEPLHKAMTISFECTELAAKYGNKLIIGSVNSSGNISSIGGKVEGGRISTTTLSFGTFTLVADQTAPKITTKNWTSGASLAGSKSISFTISDDLSGITSIVAKIDGKWALFDYDSKTSSITHLFDSSRFDYNGTSHTVELTVSDRCGNSNSYSGTFVR